MCVCSGGSRNSVRMGSCMSIDEGWGIEHKVSFPDQCHSSGWICCGSGYKLVVWGGGGGVVM